MRKLTFLVMLVLAINPTSGRATPNADVGRIAQVAGTSGDIAFHVFAGTPDPARPLGGGCVEIKRSDELEVGCGDLETTVDEGLTAGTIRGTLATRVFPRGDNRKPMHGSSVTVDLSFAHVLGGATGGSYDTAAGLGSEGGFIEYGYATVTGNVVDCTGTLTSQEFGTVNVNVHQVWPPASELMIGSYHWLDTTL